MRIFLFLVLVSVSLPFIGYAAELRVTPPFGAVHEGDTFLLDIQLSAIDDPVNAFEAALALSENLTVREIRTSRSVVPLWVTEPTLGTLPLTFAGVIPGGFEGILGTAWYGYRPGTLFRIVVEAKKVGQASVTIEPGAVAYRNDGEGSVAPLTALGTTFAVNPRGSTTKVVPPPFDETPPEEFTLDVVPGSLLGESGLVVVFAAQDKQSAVVKYEFAVSDTLHTEEDLSWREVSSPHVLKQGDEARYLYIRATDASGNARVVVREPDGSLESGTVGANLLFVIVLGMLLTLIALYVRRRGIF